jgi:hypothetical protein
LYTDSEEIIFDAQRPVIMNGIEDVGFRSDLLDRSLVLELPRIESGERRAEKVFWHEFEEARPGILGALLDAVAAALRNLPAVEQSDIEWPRMADFAAWVVAAEEALGLPAGRFLDAYNANRESASQAALESSPVVKAIFEMLKKRAAFEGTATRLGEILSIGVDTRQKGWPKNARALSGLLARMAPNLRQAGVEVEQFRSANQKLWRIRRSESTQSTQNPQSILPGGAK